MRGLLLCTGLVALVGCLGLLALIVAFLKFEYDPAASKPTPLGEEGHGRIAGLKGVSVSEFAIEVQKQITRPDRFRLLPRKRDLQYRRCEDVGSCADANDARGAFRLSVGSLYGLARKSLREVCLYLESNGGVVTGVRDSHLGGDQRTPLDFGRINRFNLGYGDIGPLLELKYPSLTIRNLCLLAGDVRLNERVISDGDGADGHDHLWPTLNMVGKISPQPSERGSQLSPSFAERRRYTRHHSVAPLVKLVLITSTYLSLLLGLCLLQKAWRLGLPLCLLAPVLMVAVSRWHCCAMIGP